MGSSKLIPVILLQALLTVAPMATAVNSNLFAEYIGAIFTGIKFSDVPINPGVDFHFILAFAIDYDTSTSPPSPADGQFGVFWESSALSPSDVAAVKQNNPNVKVAVSLGGALLLNKYTVYFNVSSVDTWVNNAVASLTGIIQQYGLDGIDIDYENFQADSDTFAECVGRLVTTLKSRGVISFASIAPGYDAAGQSHYQALWAKYASAIDYVNFQFYGLGASTTASEYVSAFNVQAPNYPGGNILASFTTSNFSNPVSPDTVLSACETLQMQGNLFGIFVWSADQSQREGFRYDQQAQALLANGQSQLVASSFSGCN